MMRLLAALLMMVSLVSEDVNAQEIDLENTLYLELANGRVVIGLRPDQAPNHVERIKELVRQKFYDGLLFHRVIPGFMAQTGDPQGTGAGGSGQNIVAEFNDMPFLRGTFGMARADDPDSADSQFFICFTRASYLDNKYTNVGRVISGMEFVDMVNPGEPPREPSKIVTLRVAADVEAGEG